MHKGRTGNKTVKIILGVILAVSAIISIYPFIYMFLLSLMETTSMKLTMQKLTTTPLSLDNYVNVLTRNSFSRYFLNSTITSIYAVVITCLLSLMAAYAFSKKRFPGKQALFMTYLATMMVPGQVTLIPTFLILKAFGLLNTYSAMVLPTCGAFGTILVHQFMKTLPNDLLEAADIDGCSEISKFIKIVVPLSKPVLISLAIFTFINVWGSLVLPLVVTTESEMTTLTVAVANMKTMLNKPNYGIIMAASTVSFLPPFILYLFLQKEFVEGIALSGIKV